jgi:alkanesulfonate monooxygenase SsuD/methylene tetrahydromethanopterin reductase-like flavin-dependent oxidoreductase (luciferase family)
MRSTVATTSTRWRRMAEPRDLDVGVVGFPGTDPVLLLDSILRAERQGAASIWFPEALADTAVLVDPVVAAAAALVATRRIGVGLVDLDLRSRSPAAVASAAVSLAALGPGRVVVGVEAAGDEAAVADLVARIGGAAAVVVTGSTVEAAALAGRIGVGWLPALADLGRDGLAVGAEAGRRAAAERDSEFMLGVRLPLPAVDQVAAVVELGGARVVLDPGPPLGADDALWSTVRQARLALRPVVPA